MKSRGRRLIELATLLVQQRPEEENAENGSVLSDDSGSNQESSLKSSKLEPEDDNSQHDDAERFTWLNNAVCDDNELFKECEKIFLAAGIQSHEKVELWLNAVDSEPIFHSMVGEIHTTAGKMVIDSTHEKVNEKVDCELNFHPSGETETVIPIEAIEITQENEDLWLHTGINEDVDSGPNFRAIEETETLICNNDADLDVSLDNNSEHSKTHDESSVGLESSQDNSKELCEAENSDVLEKRKSLYSSRSLIKNKYKITVCKFCKPGNNEVVSKHFSRHLQNKHRSEPEVKEIRETEDSRIKNQLIALLRNAGNMGGNSIIPKRLSKEEPTEETHILCPDCQTRIKKEYLCRHRKSCFAKTSEGGNRRQEIMNSYIFSACQQNYGATINKMYLKCEVLAKMRGDTAAQEVLEDVLILNWGDDLLKKTLKVRSKYHISAKMRRCANFVMEMRKISPKYTDMFSCLVPEAFDDVVHAIKQISGFDCESRTYKSASTGLQFGAYLKQMASLARKLIHCQRIQLTNTPDSALKSLEIFQNMVNEHWHVEVSGLAKKDLQKRAARKTPLLPLTENVMKLKKFVDETCREAYKELTTDIYTEKAYSTLAETVLVSTILHNRKRVGDVQYFEIVDYTTQRENIRLNTHANEFLKSLTETEKILVNNYIKIKSIGKGSRAVPVLIPKQHLKYFDLIKKIRFEKPEWFDEKNPYFFAIPKSNRWICGTSAMLKFAKRCKIPQPNLMSSCRLRKHVATVTQLLDLQENEIEQLSKFMGHTQKTHQTFYKLPDDVYQTAKISKILHLMETGKAADFKNKNLNEIELNLEQEFVDENVSDNEENDNENEANEENDNNTEEEIQERQGISVKKSLKRKKANDNNTEEELEKRQNILVKNPSKRKKANNKKNDPLKKKNTIRIRWNEEDKQLVLKAFNSSIKNRRYPKKAEIEKFINKNNSKFEEKDASRIRTLIVNTYTLK